MGTGASIQQPDNLEDGEQRQRRPIAKGPVPIEGKDYVYYPAQCSASSRPNNISVFDETLVFSSKNRVVFVETQKVSRLKAPVFRSDGVVYQTKACTIQDASGAPLRVLVVAQTSGLILWDFDKQQRIGKHTLSRSEFTEKNMPFMRGIACSDQFISVGTSTGRVLSFNAQGELGESVSVSEHSVADIASFKQSDGEQRLAIATSDGAIAVWAAPTPGPGQGKREYVLQPATSSMPMSVVPIAKTSLLAAGYSCGHIRVYSTERRELFAEIAAHARPVSSLCASAVRPQIVSSGEDSVLSVWTITEDGINLDFSSPVENTMVVGACFMGPGDQTLAAAAFDYDGVFLWNLPKGVAEGASS